MNELADRWNEELLAKMNEVLLDRTPHHAPIPYRPGVCELCGYRLPEHADDCIFTRIAKESEAD